MKLKKNKIRTRIVKNKKVATFTKQIVDANIIEVECGCNGYHGGDTGHGCRTYIRLTDLAGTDLDIRATRDGFLKEVVLTFGGDAELSTFLRALKYIYKTLTRQIAESAVQIDDTYLPDYDEGCYCDREPEPIPFE